MSDIPEIDDATIDAFLSEELRKKEHAIAQAYYDNVLAGIPFPEDIFTKESK